MNSLDITETGLSRTEAQNPYNYTEDQQATKRLALKTMKELWGNVPDLYASWAYDLCVNTPEDELKEIMRKVEEEPSRFRGAEDVKRLQKEQDERNNKNTILEIDN